MYPLRASWFVAPSRMLYNHNPFYLISAALVLFGLQRSVVDWKEDAWTIGVLFGYTMLLAVVAFAVVRFGKVWDDARTILLVIVLLLLAISVRFDVIALRDPSAGGAWLLAGLGFAVVLSEGLLRSLRIRLATRYRWPYYLLLVLLFSYPLWLATLSVRGLDRRMVWSVFLFPSVASILFLTLWPAARKKEPDVDGIPWKWPWYPWSLFAVLVVAVGLRTYWLSVSFQPGQVGAIAFQPYFLIPLGLVTAFLLSELAITAGCRWLRQLALCAPFGLLLTAFPGDGGNKIAVEFLKDLCQHLGSPAQLALVGLIVFYSVAWVRGERAAQWAVMLCLVVFGWIKADTISLSRIGAPAMWPLHCIAAIQLTMALRWNRMWRVVLAIALEIGVAWQKAWYGWPLELAVYCTVHASALLLLLAGAILNDKWSARLRSLGPLIIPAAAVLAFFTYDEVFASVSRLVDAGYLALLTLISILYWRRDMTVASLLGMLMTASVLGTFAIRRAITPAIGTPLESGWRWVGWGLVTLLIAVTISSRKGGAGIWIVRRLRLINDRLKPTPNP
jgi:hypothetical protein